MTMLRCPKCNQQSVIVVSKKNLEKFTQAQGACAAYSPVQLSLLFSIIDSTLKLSIKIFDRFNDNNTKYVICKDCGHYELLK